jgi:hypothetical protein
MGGVFNSPNLNLYAYSHLNPVVLTDPDGKSVESKALIIGGFVVRGVAWAGQAINVGEDVVTAGAGVADDVVVIPALIGLDQAGKGMIAAGLAMEAQEAGQRVLSESSEDSDNPETEVKGQTKPEVGDCPTCGGDTSNKTGKIAKEHGLSPKETKDRIHGLKGDAKITGNPDVEVCSNCGEVFPQTPDGGLGDSIGNIDETF